MSPGYIAAVALALSCATAIALAQNVQPPALHGEAAAFDQSRGRLVLFGRSSRGRGGGSVLVDRDRNTYLLFGGYSTRPLRGLWVLSRGASRFAQ